MGSGEGDHSDFVQTLDRIEGWRACIGWGVEVAETPPRVWPDVCPDDVFVFRVPLNRHVVVKLVGDKSFSEAYYECEHYVDAPSTRGVAHLT